ncbi:hypothetical protein RCL1_008525 [Eukaryota sp. TZLM3-RCL]
MFVPQALNVQIIQHLIQLRCEDSCESGEFIETCFWILCKFGNVSNNWRSITLNGISSHMARYNPILDLTAPSSGELKLISFLPLLTLSIKCSTNDILTFNTELVSRLVIQVEDHSVEDISDFLHLYNFISVRELTVDGMFDFNVCDLFTTSLPHIKSLSFTASSTLSLDTVTIPNSLCFLEELTLGNSNFPYPSDQLLTIDVSFLVNLETLTIDNGGRLAKVTGLSNLKKLKGLTLVRVTEVDGLHPEARLTSLKVSHVSHRCLEQLLHFEQCWRDSMFIYESLSFHDLSTETIHETSQQVVSLDVLIDDEHEDEAIFSLSRYPNLSILSVVPLSDYSILSIDFTDVQHLSQLKIYSPHEFLNVNRTLFIEKLDLSVLDCETLTLLLNHCPYLLHLEVSEVIEEESSFAYSTPSLNYLRYLEIEDDFGLFQLFPPLPRLKTLVLIGSHMLKLTTVNRKAPLLRTLRLEACELVQEPPCLNENIINFSLLNSEPPSADFITLLTHLEYFNYEEPDDATYHATSISLPASLKIFECNASCFIVNQALQSCPSLLVVSGLAYVNVMTSSALDECKKWIRTYSDHHPHTQVNLIAQTKIYYPDWNLMTGSEFEEDYFDGIWESYGSDESDEEY